MHTPKNFIIFDDLPDAGYGLEAHFVQTDPMNGLLLQHMEKALDICRSWK